MEEEYPKRRRTELASVNEVRDLLTLWSQEQLVDILARLGAEIPQVYAAIKDVTSKDPKRRKLFVRNLDWSTNDDSLRKVFEKYGQVEEAVVIINKADGKSKGFAFVTFVEVEAADRALEHPSKEIDGRTTMCSLAATRELAQNQMQSQQPAQQMQQFQHQPLQANHQGPLERDRGSGGGMGGGVLGMGDTSLTKLFVRSLAYTTTSEMLHAFFSQYGVVQEAVVLTHKENGSSKGYGFVNYVDPHAAQKALLEPSKQLDGRTIHCKLAVAADGKNFAPPTSGGGGPAHMQQLAALAAATIQAQHQQQHFQLLQHPPPQPQHQPLFFQPPPPMPQQFYDQGPPEHLLPHHAYPPPPTWR